jgi:hypothetical protein
MARIPGASGKWLLFQTMIKRSILFISILLRISILFGQEKDSTDRFKILPVPSFGYSPETKYYVGAVVLTTFKFDAASRSSNAKIEFIYTWRKQIILDKEWNLYLKKEKFFSQGNIHFSKYPDIYYGVGSEQQESDALSYESNRFKMEAFLLFKPKNAWYFGGGFKYTNYWNFSLNSETPNYEELSDSYSVGLISIAQLDKRNSILTATEGSFLRFSNVINSGSSVYDQVSIDARRYKTIGKKMPLTFSGRFYSLNTLGNAPFFDLAVLGGDKIARGYFYGRYRENNLLTLQTETRWTLYKWFGVAAFGGLSSIYSFNDPFNTSNLKPNGGIGLRFRVDKNEGTNLRFDYGIGSDGQSGFYISFGESF